jgi:hypothetical protein
VIEGYDLRPVEELVEELDWEKRQPVSSQENEQDAADDCQVQRAAVQQAELDADEAAFGGGEVVVIQGILLSHDHLRWHEVDGGLDDMLERDVCIGDQEGVQGDAHDVEQGDEGGDLGSELDGFFLGEEALRSLRSRRCRE